MMRMFPLLCVFLAAVSCTPQGGAQLEPDDTKYYLELSSPHFDSAGDLQVTLPSESLSEKVSVKSNGRWQTYVSSSAEGWVSCNTSHADGDGSFTVTVSRNVTGEPRRGTFYVSVPGSVSYAFVITQEASVASSVLTRSIPRDFVLFYYGDETSSQAAPTKERIMKYVLSKDSQWLFDGYILATLHNSEGRTFCPGYSGDATNQEDWLDILDYYCSRLIPLMDETAAEAAKRKGSLPRRLKVAFMIPFPPQGQLGWGTIDGETVSFDNNASKIKACKWYIDKAVDYFRAGGFENVELVGFYWLHESLGMNADQGVDAPMIRTVADYIHSKGTGFYWIPYYDIYNYSTSELAKWKEYGFDMAYYQPNYYFRSDAENSRLETAVSRAHAAGAGMEMEFDWKAISWYSGSDAASMNYSARMKRYITEFESSGVWSQDYVAYYEYHALEYFYDSSNKTDSEIYDLLTGKIASRQKTYYNIGE